MYNDIICIIAIILGGVGTVKTLLSILKMRLKDVIYMRTASGFDTQELPALQQVYDARVGIVWVILSGGIQVFEKLYGEMDCNAFLILVVIITAIFVIWWYFMYHIYKKGMIKLIQNMPEVIREGIPQNMKKFLKYVDTSH